MCYCSYLTGIVFKQTPHIKNYFQPSAAPLAVKHPTKQACYQTNWVQNKKERQKEGWEGKGESSICCYNKLLPSKVPNAWRNIPLHHIVLLFAIIWSKKYLSKSLIVRSSLQDKVPINLMFCHHSVQFSLKYYLLSIQLHKVYWNNMTFL